MLSDHVRAEASALALRFSAAEPFRHVVIEDFLEPAFAERLLATFPDFNPAKAINEDGVVGAKSVHERIRALGPAYVALDEMIQGRDFLDLVSRITGIPGLRYDPYYFGGGTHDNRNGQGLNAHVDFNRHPVTHSHRRLNLIVYLNHDWQPDWGGVLELHSDPRATDDRVESVVPGFNRAVIFETTEHSWHGFSKIALPPEQAGRSRRSVALYFYTDERPAEESAATHSTVYVDAPLPARFQAGLTLSQADAEELRARFAERDQHIRRLYGEVQGLQARLEQALRGLGLVRGSLPYRTIASLRRGLRRLAGK